MGCSCSKSDAPKLIYVNPSENQMTSRSNEEDLLFARPSRILRRPSADQIQLRLVGLDSLEEENYLSMTPLELNESSPNPCGHTKQSSTHTEPTPRELSPTFINQRQPLYIINKPNERSRQSICAQKQLLSKKSISLKFQKTGINSIDNILDEVSFPLFTLENAYNSLHRAMYNFKEATFTVNEKLSRSIFSMIFFFAVHLEGSLSKLNLVILEEPPFIKFNEKLFEEKHEKVLKTWNKLHSATKELEVVRKGIDHEIKTVSGSIEKVESMAGFARGNTLRAFKNDLNILYSVEQIEEEIDKTLGSFYKHINIAVARLKAEETIGKLQDIGKEAKAVKTYSLKDIADLYLMEIEEMLINDV